MLPNFDEFLAPRQLMYSPGSSARVGKALQAWGIASGKVFIVADKIVNDLGALKALVDGLHDAGFETDVFAEIAGEPNDEIVDRAAAAGRIAKPSVIVGVGGGSALDSAKLVNYLVQSGKDLKDLKGVVEPLDNFLPMALVPTTTGTGSEATRIAMFAVQGLKRAVSNRQFVPTVAALDPDLVAGLPPAVVASTALDALAHSIESMLSTDRNSFTMMVGGEASRIIFRKLRAAVLDNDPEAKGELLYASYLAGMALNAGVILGHSLSYVIASRRGLPHGTGCALALPYCMAYNNTVDPELSAHIARLITDGDSDDFAQLAVDIEQLTREVGLPTSMEETGIVVGQIDELVDEVISDFPRPTNPIPFTKERLTALLDHMQVGNLSGAWTAMQEGAKA